MVKVTVLYGKPVDPAAFERYYAETHMPLVRRAGLPRSEAAKVVGTPDGSESQFYRTFEFWMNDMDQLHQAMGTPVFGEVVGDLRPVA